MTYSLDRGDWLFRQYDTSDDRTPYRFRFLRWVGSGGRDDLAAVAVDGWVDWQGRAVDHAVLAARHSGFDLHALTLDQWPAHVHILTTRPELVGADHFDPSSFSRTAWATVEPVDVTLPPTPEFQAFTVRRDPSTDHGARG